MACVGRGSRVDNGLQWVNNIAACMQTDLTTDVLNVKHEIAAKSGDHI